MTGKLEDAETDHDFLDLQAPFTTYMRKQTNHSIWLDFDLERQIEGPSVDLVGIIWPGPRIAQVSGPPQLIGVTLGVFDPEDGMPVAQAQLRFPFAIEEFHSTLEQFPRSLKA